MLLWLKLKYLFIFIYFYYGQYIRKHVIIISRESMNDTEIDFLSEQTGS